MNDILIQNLKEQAPSNHPDCYQLTSSFSVKGNSFDRDTLNFYLTNNCIATLNQLSRMDYWHHFAKYIFTNSEAGYDVAYLYQFYPPEHSNTNVYFYSDILKKVYKSMLKQELDKVPCEFYNLQTKYEFILSTKQKTEV